MAFSYYNLLFGSSTFCFCIPVRIGVVVMSVLGILLSGTLSVGLWFEVASASDVSGGAKAAFIVAAVVETMVFISSILGFVGTIVRKQAFIRIFAYTTYGYFILTFGLASFLLVIVVQFSSSAIVKACQDTIQNEQARNQCTGLFNIAKGVYVAVALLVLATQLYGIIVVTRYLNQLKGQDISARASLLAVEGAFRLVPTSGAQYTILPDLHEGEVPPVPESYYEDPFGEEFNPYDPPRHRNPHDRSSTSSPRPPTYSDSGHLPWQKPNIAAKAEETEHIELQNLGKPLLEPSIKSPSMKEDTKPAAWL